MHSRLSLIFGCALLATSVSVANSRCPDPKKVAEVDLELGIIQYVAALGDTDPDLEEKNGVLLAKSLKSAVDDFQNEFRTISFGLAGYSSYNASGDGDRVYCNKFYGQLETDPDVIKDTIDSMVGDDFFPAENADAHKDSSLSAAMMALSQMQFSKPTGKKDTLRILMIQSDREPSVAPKDPRNPFRGDGSDTCAMDPPSVAQVKQMLIDRDAYIGVITTLDAHRAWRKICKELDKCITLTVPSIYNTDPFYSGGLIGLLYCQWRPDGES